MVDDEYLNGEITCDTELNAHMKYLKLITAFNINGGVDIPGIIKFIDEKLI